MCPDVRGAREWRAPCQLLDLTLQRGVRRPHAAVLQGSTRLEGRVARSEQVTFTDRAAVEAMAACVRVHTRVHVCVCV